VDTRLNRRQPIFVEDLRLISLDPERHRSQAVRDARHPGVRATLRARSGDANQRRVSVKLPLSIALDPDRTDPETMCEYEDGLRFDCPCSAVIGRARAVSPLLNRALSGPVYFSKTGGPRRGAGS
jgi:hypothetical protein